MTNSLPFVSERVTFDTAAAHACTQVPIATPMSRIGDIHQALVGQRYESATHIVVCDAGKFCGILRLEDVLAAPPDTLASTVMDTDPPVVAPGVDQEVAAWRAVQHAESALAVVDAASRFVGLIPPPRLLAVLLSEHEEDLSRLGGFLKNTAMARHTSEEAILRRFWHRLPWLLLGLAGALFAADMVGWFECQLQDNVLLAFCVAGVVYLADAVGTQTETVIVRGLSVGVAIKQIVWRELLTGGRIGVALALVAFPRVSWRWGAKDIALGVSLSLLAACATATIAAMALPWGFERFGVDPALGSGPLATVIQDLLSILLYFAMVTAMVR